jgi:hypothetical protein
LPKQEQMKKPNILLMLLTVATAGDAAARLTKYNGTEESAFKRVAAGLTAIWPNPDVQVSLNC